MLKTAVAPVPSSCSKLQSLFGEGSTFAWDLLEQEIRIESNPHITGKEIADLLTLYMRAVEKMNSAHDSREIYFRNKVSGLMVRPQVLKAMTNTHKEDKPSSKPQPTPTGPTSNESFYNTLQSKKKEMEMHMTYQTEGVLAKEKVSNMLAQHTNQADTLDQQIQQAISQNTSRLEERIKQRKLRAYSSRTKSEKTFQTPINRLQPANIEVIQEEQDEHTKQNAQMPEKPRRPKRFSLSPKRSSMESPEEPEKEKVRRRSTIVELHRRLTMDD